MIFPFLLLFTKYFPEIIVITILIILYLEICYMILVSLYLLRLIFIPWNTIYLEKYFVCILKRMCILLLLGSVCYKCHVGQVGWKCCSRYDLFWFFAYLFCWEGYWNIYQGGFFFLFLTVPSYFASCVLKLCY